MRQSIFLSRWRRKLGFLLAALVGLVLIVLASLAWQVDDWSRDLRVNWAESIQSAPDRALRPLELSTNVAQTERQIRTVASALTGWQFVDVKNRDSGAVEQHYTRTTPFLRFVDDIFVTITPTTTGSRVQIRSQSRVGKGDLGQNPRNIRELTSALMALEA